MPTDPYGFPDSAAGAGREGPALISLWTGVGAIVCGALGPCLCYTPWLLALPLSGVAVWYGIQAKSGGRTGDTGLDAASTAGLVTGLVALCLSLLYLSIALVYVGAVALVAVGEL